MIHRLADIVITSYSIHYTKLYECFRKIFLINQDMTDMMAGFRMDLLGFGQMALIQTEFIF